MRAEVGAMINASWLSRVFVEERVEPRAIAAAQGKSLAAMSDDAILTSRPHVKFLYLVDVDDRRAMDSDKTSGLELRLHFIHRLAQ